MHPDAMAAVAASDYAAERRALAATTAEISPAVDALPGAEAEHPLFNRLVAAWAGEPDDVRRAGVAGDVVLIHIASMSNLFAALGWALVDLLEHPDECVRVAAGDRARGEQCALESTRLAQRSIMSRYVVAPVRLETGDAEYEVGTGTTIATLLPLTNTSAAPGLDAWAPDRWNRRRLADAGALAAPELVTAFGHGKHTCPAQPFSLATMTAAVTKLFGTFAVEPTWSEHPQPVPAQIGGVARARDACVIRYRRHPEGD